MIIYALLAFLLKYTKNKDGNLKRIFKSIDGYNDPETVS
jgi:hypothetical protein